MNPYLSFIVAARNDNYGGNFLERLQVFVNVLAYLLGKHGLNSELVIVEWNPPDDRARLREVLIWPRVPNGVVIRLIEVPARIHRPLPNSDKLPMFDCFAKNVGIRRAKGEYILVTNPDILFSDELVAYLASKRLSRHRLYRIDRYDFHGPIPLSASPQDALRCALRNVYQVNIRGDDPRRMGVEIGVLRRWYTRLSGRWPGTYKGNKNLNSREEPLVVLNDDNGICGGVYTNASGDFLLASSQSWAEIRGFPEFTDTFTHLDSYGCHQLKALGLEQSLLLPPCMILHWEHSREEQRLRPAVPSEKWEKDLKEIREGILGPAINGENWGLGEEQLPETALWGGAG